MSWGRESVALLDGAMGTMLFAVGLKPGQCGELWNIDRESQVEAIHRAYVEAGAQILTTNTFGGSPIALARHGVTGVTGEINRAGVAVARKAAAGKAMVFGGVGPLGVLFEPYGDLTKAEAEQAFRSQINAFSVARADGVVIETMGDPVEMAIAVRVAREFGSWPIIATYAFQKGFRTFMGREVSEALQAAVEAGADVVGANCGTELGLDDFVELAKEMVAIVADVPVALQPNAGTPEMTEEGLVYKATPEAMAACIRASLGAGVRVVGGCCGTRPEHIAGMARETTVPV